MAFYWVNSKHLKKLRAALAALDEKVDAMATKEDLDQAISKLNDALTAESAKITGAIAALQAKVAADAAELDVTTEVQAINDAATRIGGLVPEVTEGAPPAATPANPAGGAPDAGGANA